MEKELFELVESLDPDDLDNFSVHYTKDYPDFRDESFKVYIKAHCFDVRKIYICESDEVSEVRAVDQDVNDNGYNYTYYALWDGFKELPLKKAIELIKNEGVFV